MSYLPAILPPGELFCSVRICPAASGFSVPPDEPGGRRSSVRLYPEAPGRYTVELALTGEIELRRTLEVEVADSPPPAAEEGPPIAFTGASLATDDVRAGETAQLTLDWEARRQPPEDYTIFAQLIGADGKVWGQYDAPAGWTSHYSSTWLPGERVSLSWPVAVKPDAPPSQYRLLLGMYRRTATGIERVPVRWPAGDATEYWVGEVTVR